MEDKYIVIDGNPVDGFDYTGPFESEEDAIHYAEFNLAGIDWWIAPLRATKER